MSRHTSPPPPEASPEPRLDAHGSPDNRTVATVDADEARSSAGNPDHVGDDEPDQGYPGSRAPDEDAPAGPDEVERLAAHVLRAERRLRLIEELGERSMALVRLVHRRAMAEEQDAAEAAESAEGEAASAAATGPGPDAAAGSFAKLSRTVRLCLDMEARADETLRALRDGAPAVRAVREERRDREAKAHREKVKLEILAIMDPVIREAADSEAREREIIAAVVERLSFDHAYEDFDDWDALVTVARLCSDLDLKPDWNAWTPDGWPLPEGEDFPRPAWSPFNRVSGKPILRRTQAICSATQNRLE